MKWWDRCHDLSFLNVELWKFMKKKMIAKVYAKHVLIFRLRIWDWQYNYLHLENRDTEADECCLLLFATPWTVACQAPLSMQFPRQEYWSGLSFLSPGAFPDPVIKSVLHWQAGSLPLSHQGTPDTKVTEVKFKNHIFYLQSAWSLSTCEFLLLQSLGMIDI